MRNILKLIVGFALVLGFLGKTSASPEFPVEKQNYKKITKEENITIKLSKENKLIYKSSVNKEKGEHEDKTLDEQVILDLMIKSFSDSRELEKLRKTLDGEFTNDEREEIHRNGSLLIAFAYASEVMEKDVGSTGSGKIGMINTYVPGGCTAFATVVKAWYSLYVSHGVTMYPCIADYIQLNGSTYYQGNQVTNGTMQGWVIRNLSFEKYYGFGPGFGVTSAYVSYGNSGDTTLNASLSW